jgi:hypothetical protein
VINERQYIKDTLYDLVEAVVRAAGREDEVIWRNDNGTRPVPPFIAIEIVGGSRRGFPWKSLVKINADNPEDMGEQTIVQPGKKTLTIYGFGEGSFDLLETIRDSVYLEDYKNMLAQKGLVLLNVMDVTGTPAEIDGIRENEPHFDFDVAFNRVFTDRPGWIEHVKIKTDDLPMKPIEN